MDENLQPSAPFQQALNLIWQPQRPSALQPLTPRSGTLSGINAAMPAKKLPEDLYRPPMPLPGGVRG